MAIRIGGRIWVGLTNSICLSRMAGIGASCPFPWVLANVPSPNPQQPFAAGNGTGAPRPALIDLLPGEPPKGKLMEAKVTKVAKVSARFSKSLARRRLRPNQEKVRSTTQRRGKMTKPFMSSLRLTISMRSKGTFATAASTCQAL